MDTFDKFFTNYKTINIIPDNLLSSLSDFNIEESSLGLNTYELVTPPEFKVLTKLEDSNTGNYIIDFFINKGLSENLARGIYGNIMLESGGNSRAVSKDGYNSFGLALWTGDRKDRLFEMFGDNPSSEELLEYLWWELNNTEKEAFNSLLKTESVRDATKVFMDKFERPSKRYANFLNRLNYANYGRRT